MKTLILNSNPKSMFSESIKTIRTNLAFSSLGDKMTVILNTSPEAGDGKSFISANLAVAYAHEGKKVLIIDCDLRKGRQHEIFEVDNSIMHGYSNLILNYNKDTKLDEYVISTDNKNVFLIPTGPMPPNPIELLDSDNNKKLMQSLRKEFDIIILDCPPVVGLSDALILTKYSDANIIVVSNKKTKLENLERTKKAFEQIGSKITGVIINRAEVNDGSYYGYYCNDSYYNSDNKKSKKRRIRKSGK